MPEYRPGRVRNDVVAHAAIVHGQIAYDGGVVGEAVKTAIPAQDAPRTTLQNIAAGEPYNSIITGVVSAPLAGLEAATQGQLIYIDTTTNALGLASGAGKVPAGRVAYLAGQQGGPTDRIRIDLNQKV